MDNFNLKKYLAEGRLLKEDESVLKDMLADLEQEKKDIFRYMKTDPTYKPEGGITADYYNQELDRIEASMEKIRKQLNAKEGRLFKEEEVDYQVELLVPKVAYDVNSGELADSPYAFATKDEIESGEADITTYTDGDELDEWVFSRDYEQAKDFAERYPNLIKLK